MIDEVFNHYRQALQNYEQVVCRFPIDIFLIESDVELRTDLTAGAFRNVKELDELLITSTLKSFGDIRHDRNRGTSHLIP